MSQANTAIAEPIGDQLAPGESAQRHTSHEAFCTLRQSEHRLWLWMPVWVGPLKLARTIYPREGVSVGEVLEAINRTPSYSPCMSAHERESCFRYFFAAGGQLFSQNGRPIADWYRNQDDGMEWSCDFANAELHDNGDVALWDYDVHGDEPIIEVR